MIFDNPWADGWFFITEEQAKDILWPKPLPKSGREALVLYQDKHYWVQFTYIPSQHSIRWTIREARGWKLVNGLAVSGSNK